MKVCSVEGCNTEVYAKGLCARCYKREQYHANKLKPKKPTTVADLPGETWKPLPVKGFFVSNQGRVKRITKTKKGKKAKLITISNLQKHRGHSTFQAAGKTYRLALEVLRAFTPPENGEQTHKFKNEDITDCRLENLAWYGYDYMIGKAIAMAEDSKSPLADCFLLFWHGKNDALDDFFAKVRDVLGRMINKRIDLFRAPFYLDVEDITSEALIQIFYRIKNAQIKTIDNIMAWCKAIAKKVLAKRIHYAVPAISMFYQKEADNVQNIIDLNGRNVYPSAELEAIYNLEVICA